MRIGLFDSGIGGLSILNEVFKLLPNEDYVYYLDNAFCPYGQRPDHIILERSRLMMRSLIEDKCDLIIIACNTATACAIDTLRGEFNLPIIGVEPFVTGVGQGSQSRPQILLTQATSVSKRLANLLNKTGIEKDFIVTPCSGLVELIEDGFPLFDDGFEKKLEQYLKSKVDEMATHLVLGCTHYALIEAQISNLTQRPCFKPGPGVAHRVAQLTKGLPSESKFDLLVKLTKEDSLLQKQVYAFVTS